MTALTETETCGETTKMSMETGIEKMICALPAGHDGQHWDTAFFRAWE